MVCLDRFFAHTGTFEPKRRLLVQETIRTILHEFFLAYKIRNKHYDIKNNLEALVEARILSKE